VSQNPLLSKKFNQSNQESEKNHTQIRVTFKWRKRTQIVKIIPNSTRNKWVGLHFMAYKCIVLQPRNFYWIPVDICIAPSRLLQYRQWESFWDTLCTRHSSHLCKNSADKL